MKAPSMTRHRQGVQGVRDCQVFLELVFGLALSMTRHTREGLDEWDYQDALE